MPEIGDFKPRAFQGKPEEPNYLLGFGASALSSIPELFGAQPWQTAEAFRTANPWSGLASEMLGFAVPYLGAEAAVLKSPALAARLGAATESLVGRAGMVAAESPIASGAARELIINAPIEAARLASGAAFYPETFDEQFGNVMTDVALTAGMGGAFGALSKAGPRRSARTIIEGTGLWDSATYRLDAVMNGAEVKGMDPEDLMNELEREVLTGNPGYTGAKGDKPRNYVGKIPGLTPDEQARLETIFKPEAGRWADEGAVDPITGEPNPDAPPKGTGYSKQYFWENNAEGGPGKNLNPGERGELLATMPEGLRSSREVAATFEDPRVIRIMDDDGARAFAGILSNNKWQKVGKTWMMQERDGPFIQLHKAIEGEGSGYGNGVEVKPGDVFFAGKTAFPGRIEPAAAQMAGLVNKNWATKIRPFQPSGSENLFDKVFDDMITALGDEDFEAARAMRNDKKRVSFLAEKFGAAKAQTKGLLDAKFNFADSRAIQELAESVSRQIKPTIHLQHANPHYNKFIILKKAGHDYADRLVKTIVHGKETIEGTPIEALSGKNIGRESGFMGHRPLQEMGEHATDDDADMIVKFANGNVATPEAFQQAVKEGHMTEAGRNLAEGLRALNQDWLGSAIIPALTEANHADVAWLENHLGIPKVAQGDHFITVTDAVTGDLKHTAFGRNGKEAHLNADMAIRMAGEEGETWTKGDAKLRELPSESDDVLKELQARIAGNLERNPTDVKILTKAMKQLAIIKGTTGKGPSIPVTSKAFQKRKGGEQTTADIKKYTKDDLYNAVQAHLNNTAHFASETSFQSRFGDSIPDLLKHDPKLQEDLTVKGLQYLGIATPFSNALDKKLSNLLGGVGGARPATKISAAVNKGLYGMTLGWFNPAFAVLNVLSPLQTVAPKIAHMLSIPSDEAAHLLQFTPVIGEAGKPIGQSAWVEPIKLLYQAVKLARNPTPELRAAQSQGVTDGLFGSHLLDEWSGGNSRARQTLTEAWDQGGLPKFIGSLSTLMADKSESFSRLIAFNAAFLMGKNIFKLEGDALYNMSRKMNEMTMYSYHTVDRSNMFTGPVGSMFGLFKNWQMHFMGSMFQYADQAVNKGNFAPLVWAGGSAVALGGLGATPLIAMADGLANWENEANSSYLWMEKNFGDTLADPLYFGLPAFLGVSLQASSTLPGTDVRNETASLFSFAIAQRATMLGKAAGKGYEYAMATGNNPMNDSNVRDMFFQATTPRAFIRALSVVEGDYVKSMSTGYPMIDGKNVGFTGKMLQGLGMNDLEIAKAQEASQVLYASEEKMKSAISGLGRGYYNAISDRDYDEAQRIMNRTIAMHVPIDSVMRSAMAIKNREENSDLLSRYNVKGQIEARQATGMEY